MKDKLARLLDLHYIVNEFCLELGNAERDEYDRLKAEIEPVLELPERVSKALGMLRLMRDGAGVALRYDERYRGVRDALNRVIEVLETG